MRISSSYLSLIKLGIDHQADIPAEIDWKAVRTLASKQGLAAIVLDGVKVLMEKAPSALKGLNLDFKLDWVAECVVGYEQRYEDYRKTIAELAAFYKENGFKMMVLKGYGLSLNYPVPSHRPCGDIDIWQFGDFKKADEAVAREFGIKIDNSHHHHTTFDYKGYLVENHYDIINVHYSQGDRKLEGILKKLAVDESNFVEIKDIRVYLPSANLHSLFLIKHCMSHFASTFISLRQLLDWALFVEKHTSEIDWKWLCAVLEDFHMLDFFNYLNAICIEDLGFDAELFGGKIFTIENDRVADTCVIDTSLKKRILADIISPEFTEEEPTGPGLFRRVAFKYRRWQANAWKQRLCYSDNRFVAFWKSAWAHLLKPSSI